MRRGRELSLDAELALSRSSATRRCISPCPHSTISWVLVVVLKRQRGIFLDKLGDGAGQLHLVLAVATEMARP